MNDKLEQTLATLEAEHNQLSVTLLAMSYPDRCDSREWVDIQALHLAIRYIRNKLSQTKKQ